MTPRLCVRMLLASLSSLYVLLYRMGAPRLAFVGTSAQPTPLFTSSLGWLSASGGFRDCREVAALDRGAGPP